MEYATGFRNPKHEIRNKNNNENSRTLKQTNPGLEIQAYDFLICFEFGA